jgi:hypothetical protein
MLCSYTNYSIITVRTVVAGGVSLVLRWGELQNIYLFSVGFQSPYKMGFAIFATEYGMLFACNHMVIP